jgi:general secretion pathway protein K
MSLIEAALPFVTVYSGRPQVNVLDARPEILAALPGMTTDLLNTVLAQRNDSPENAQALLPLLKDAQQYATTDGGKTFRVTVRVAFDSGHTDSAEVVILLFDQGSQPFSILEWRDGFEQTIAGHKL